MTQDVEDIPAGMLGVEYDRATDRLIEVKSAQKMCEITSVELEGYQNSEIPLEMKEYLRDALSYLKTASVGLSNEAKRIEERQRRIKERMEEELDVGFDHSTEEVER